MRNKTFPSIGDKVMCKYHDENEIGVYLQLVEYNDIIGLMQYSEISRRRRLQGKIDKTKMFVTEVINVDPIRRNVDLSKKNLTSEEIDEHERFFASQKRVQSVVHRLAQLTETNETEVYNTFIFTYFGETDEPLQELYHGKREYPDHEWSNHLKGIIQHVYKPKPVTIVCTIECGCFGPDGIDAIKQVLSSAKQNYPDIKINLIASPMYMIQMVDRINNIEQDLVYMQRVAEFCVTNIQQFEQGFCNIVEEPKVVDTV